MSILLVLLCSFNSRAQEQEAEQLLLNVEKLSQLKKVLADLKQGYQTLLKGYNSIRDVSEGNFRLHDAFLAALFEVSPVVRNYYRVKEIIVLQIRLVQNSRKAFSAFFESEMFGIEEVNYFSKVLRELINSSLKSLKSLAIILTAHQLRMSDDERLKEIDRIWNEISDEGNFLHSFLSSIRVLGIQRAKAKGDITAIKNLYSLSF